MKISPLDIRNPKLSTAWRGFNRQETEQFLEVIAEEVESLARELSELREDNRRMRQDLDLLRERENQLTQALLMAQNLQETLRQNAEKEAEIIISQAELNADKIVQDANLRLAKLLSEIRELKLQRSAVFTQVRSTLESHLRTLEMLEGDRDIVLQDDKSGL